MKKTFFIIFFLLFIFHLTGYSYGKPAITLYIDGIDENQYVNVGEAVFITVRALNSGSYSPKGGISVSLPDYKSCSVYSIIGDGDIFYAGDQISHVIKKKKMKAEYPLMELWEGDGWAAGSSRTLKIKIIPREKGTIRVYVRCVLRDTYDNDIYCPESGNKDQQGAYVVVCNIKVGNPPTPTPEPTFTPKPTMNSKPASTPQTLPSNNTKNTEIIPSNTGNVQSSNASIKILLCILIGLLGLIVLILIINVVLRASPARVPVYHNQSGSFPPVHSQPPGIGELKSSYPTNPMPEGNIQDSPYLSNTSTSSISKGPEGQPETVVSGNLQVANSLAPVPSPAINFCPKCGEPANKKFCGSCGTNIPEKSSPPPVPAVKKPLFACEGCGHELTKDDWGKLESGRCPVCEFENEY